VWERDDPDPLRPNFYHFGTIIQYEYSPSSSSLYKLFIPSSIPSSSIYHLHNLKIQSHSQQTNTNLSTLPKSKKRKQQCISQPSSRSSPSASASAPRLTLNPRPAAEQSCLIMLAGVVARGAVCRRGRWLGRRLPAAARHVRR
jgi:hypothetical protein